MFYRTVSSGQSTSVSDWIATSKEAILNQGRVYTERMPRTGSPNLFGRDAELDAVTDAWNDQKLSVFSIVAAGGVGKSALCRKWLANVSKQNYLGAERVYAWSFYSQGTTEKNVSADPFIQHALRWFGDPKPEDIVSPTAKGYRLAHLIKSRSTLLILDGLEPLQFPPGQQGGVLKDKSMLSLLQTLAESPGNCLTLITTRVAVTELAHWHNSSVKEIFLDALSPTAGAQLLSSLGAKEHYPKELEKISEKFGGHSLALLLLGNYLRQTFKGHNLSVDGVDPWIEEEEQGGQARRVMRSYTTWFRDSGYVAEIELLHVLGLFDRPAPGDVVRAIREEPGIAGLTQRLCTFNEKDWTKTVERLRSLGLLSGANEFEPDALDAHPLVREHFGPNLQKELPESWKEGNRRLYQHLAETAEEFPNDPPAMERLYSAVNHACAAGERKVAFRELIYKRAWRCGSDNGDNYYATRRLGMFGADFVALAQFFETQWNKLLPGLEYRDEFQILTDTAVRLRSLGRLPNAMECLNELVKRIKHNAHPDLAEDAAYAVATLSELQLVCGMLVEAERSAKLAIQNAESGSRPYFRMHSRSSMADVMMQTGKVHGARQFFDEALSIFGAREELTTPARQKLTTTERVIR